MDIIGQKNRSTLQEMNGSNRSRQAHESVLKIAEKPHVIRGVSSKKITVSSPHIGRNNDYRIEYKKALSPNNNRAKSPVHDESTSTKLFVQLLTNLHESTYSFDMLYKLSSI